jgi:hypothetical protein
MKTFFKALFAGLLSVLIIEAIARVIIAIYFKQEFMFTGYVLFPGLGWPAFLLFISGFGAFFGGMMIFTIGGSKFYAFYTFLILILLYRLIPAYNEPPEPLYIVFISMLLSVAGAFLSMKLHNLGQANERAQQLSEEDKENFD